MSSTLNVQKRVTISLALHRYLRAVDRFEDASNEFNEACKAIRSSLPKPSRFVAQVSHQHYLVTSDQDGNFEVDQIDLV
jgi:hypothetical protein